MELSTILAASEALRADLNNAGLTAPGDLPISGTGTYEGVLSAVPSFDSNPGGFEPTLFGATSISVDFGGGAGNPAGTFSGSANRFVNGDGDLVPGAVSLSGSFTGGDISGTLSGNFLGDAGTINATGDLDGEFRGATGEFLRADINNGTLSGADSGTFVGDIVTERTTCVGC